MEAAISLIVYRLKFDLPSSRGGVYPAEAGLARGVGLSGGERGSTSERAVGRGKSPSSLKSESSSELAPSSRTRRRASFAVSRLAIVKRGKQRFFTIALYNLRSSYAMRACAEVRERESSCVCPLKVQL